MSKGTRLTDEFKQGAMIQVVEREYAVTALRIGVTDLSVRCG